MHQDRMCGFDSSRWVGHIEGGQDTCCLRNAPTRLTAIYSTSGAGWDLALDEDETHPELPRLAATLYMEAYVAECRIVPLEDRDWCVISVLSISPRQVPLSYL